MVVKVPGTENELMSAWFWDGDTHSPPVEQRGSCRVEQSDLSPNSELKTAPAPVFIHIYPTFILHLLFLKPSHFFRPDLLTSSHSNCVHREALASASPSRE